MRRASESCLPPRAGRGFTLVEMIVVIVITGIAVAMVAMFGRHQILSYLDVGNRADLADAADTALRRIARDLQSALPNSVRQAGNFLELVPMTDAGRYRADVGGAPDDDPLDFGDADDGSFAVLGPSVTIGNGEQLVIFNLGQPGSDVYAGSSRRAATPGAGLTTIRFTPGGTQFPLPSPQNRFQIVGTPVTYECAADAADPAQGRLLRHTGYGFLAGQPTDFAALRGTRAVLVGDVAACSFSYLPGVLQRDGLVVLRLTLSRNGEVVDLLHQIEVLNTP